MAGCQEKKNVILATVGGKPITQSDLDHRLAGIPAEIRAAATERKKEFIEDIVSEELLLQEAEKRGINRLADVKQLQEEARKKILIAKLIELEVDNGSLLGSADALSYYEAHKEEFKAPLLLRASHILVKTEEEAVSIKSQLDLGADFEELARAKSIDATGKRGGDLGFFQKGQLVPEFEEAVFEMKKGSIAGPVKTNFGYHIIKLTDRIEPSVRDYESIRKPLEEKLIMAKRRKSLKELVDRLKTKITVTFNEKAVV